MQLYLKFIAQVVATVVAGIIAALGSDNHVTSSEWVNVAILALGAIAVLGAGNLPAGVWAHTKLIVSAATAVVVLLQSYITDGITGQEWLQLLMGALGAIGVFAVKGPVVETLAPSRRRRAI